MIEIIRENRVRMATCADAGGRVASPGQADDNPKPSSPTRFLGRQPILTSNSARYGYELLYRQDQIDPISGHEGETAQQVIDNYLLLMPALDQGKIFVPCTRETLVTGLATLLPRRNTVLTIQDTVQPDAEVLASCRSLRKMGYSFGLDGFTGCASKMPFLDFADYLKVDYQACDAETRCQIHALAGQARINNKVIAERIDSADELEIARREGCQLFLGGFFAQPSTVSYQVIPGNQLICLRLMAALSEEPADTVKIEALVMLDTSLCFRLLRLVNSVLYSLNSPVTSIRGALVIVGTDEFRKLVTVSLAGVLAATQSKTLVAMALERARFCEMLAPRLQEDGPKLYLLGMLSLIDAILSLPMWQVIESIPLDPDMKAVLMGGQGRMGVALELIRSYQAGDWEGCERHQQKLGLEEQATSKIYMESVHWADQAMSA